MSYLDAGFDNNLIRNIYPDYESLEDSSIIGEILTAGAIPTGEITNALVASGILNSDNALIADLISSSLNTQSKEILGSFTFGASGALAIATDANNGLWISPTGILAKKAGENTVAITAGGDATFGGTLVAASGTLGTITSGIITGATIQTASTGYRAVMSNSVGYQLYSGATYLGKMSCSAGGSVIIDSLDNIYFRDQSKELAHLDSTGLVLPNAGGIVISSGGRLRYTGGFLYFDGSTGGELGIKLEGSFLPHKNNDDADNIGDTNYRWHSGWFEDVYVDDIVINSGGSITVAGNSGDDEEFEVGTSFRKKDGVYQWRARLLTFKKGILTNLGDESGWRDIT